METLQRALSWVARVEPGGRSRGTFPGLHVQSTVCCKHKASVYTESAAGRRSGGVDRWTPRPFGHSGLLCKALIQA